MDIVERLRIRIHTSEDETALTNEAADEIERLREDLIEAEKYNGYHQQACLEIERLREQVKELATALEFESNYDGHKLLARSALQQKDTER